MKKMLIVASAMLMAGPAIAADPAQDALEEAAKAAAEATADERGKNAYICKTFPPPTGTRLGRDRQICKTQAEWEMIDNDIQTSIQENTRQALQGKPVG